MELFLIIVMAIVAAPFVFIAIIWVFGNLGKIGGAISVVALFVYLGALTFGGK
jgi:hypothetical protein